MHPEIEKLIEMALADGRVTDKEREIILRKAEKLGLDVDEVEMYLEGIIGSEKDILEDESNNSDIRYEKCYFEKDNLLEWLEYLFSINDCYKRFTDENILKTTFLEWIFYKFKKQFIFKVNFDYLSNLLNVDGTAEYNSRDFIRKIIESEEFFGFYVRLSNKLLEKNELELLLPQIIKSSYSSYIITNKAIYSFGKKTKKEVIKKLFFESERILNYYDEPKRLSYEEIVDPYLYSLNKIPNNEIKIFATKFSSYYKENFSMYEVIKKIHFNFSFDLANDVIKNSNLKNIEIDKLMRIHNYLNNEIEYLNDFIKNLKDKEFVKKGVVNYEYNCNLKELKIGLNHEFGYNSYILNIIEFIVNKISFLTNIIFSRDLLLNSFLSNDIFMQNSILLLLEDNGVFLNKFERDVLSSLESINASLGKINKTLSDGFNELIDVTERINESVVNSSLTVKELGDKLDGIGILNLISTYQLYKINKQTKSLKN